ncbi:transglycosylase family protein [Streptomyces sp. NPDC088400]|uniref:LysM peptidoglycan-binding domain-containing protein n=1 Tax=Streptomyces sp. NPDC088400 TaxID=3365861 RepID=UPI0037FE3977
MPSSSFVKRSVETFLAMLLAPLLIPLSVLGLAGQSAAAVVKPSLTNGTDWNRIAACESGGRWHINTGNGYHGGLQIAPSTWRAYGGHRYAPRADLASQSEQIAVGERIVQARGLSPWPHCGRNASTSSGSTYSGSSGSGSGQSGSSQSGSSQSGSSQSGSSGSGSVTQQRQSAPSTSARRSHSGSASSRSGSHSARPISPNARTYVVRSGDCLSVIAHRADVDGGTKALYRLNKRTLDKGPDHIYPGQRLRLRA